MEGGVDTKAILDKLTIEEKISLLAGANIWESVAIPAKGVPAFKTSDGPNGARGAKFGDGLTSACFPAACCIAATFEPELALRVGRALANETKSKGARCLLGPTMCIQRHPLGGRNFESFSEDAFLTGKMAIAMVKGIQSQGVSATVKHFVANEQETCRLTVDTIVSERALREIYLRPFEMAIKEANPWAVMTSYNLVNGEHADSNALLLKQVLRGEWGWDGLVMSDWGGTNSTAAALIAGLDLEMPGPTRWRQPEVVMEALELGALSEQVINDRALHVLDFAKRLGCFEDSTIAEEKSIDRAEDRALIREAASKGIVLLKNKDNTLPLTKEKLLGKKVALLGYAKMGLAHGGGSASVNAHYRVTPWDAFQRELGDVVEFSFAKGAHTMRNLPPITENITDNQGGSGFTWRLYHPGTTEPVQVVHGHKLSEVDALDSQHIPNMEVILEATYTATETGPCYLTCSGLGPSTLAIDDRIVFEQTENCNDGMAFIFGGVPAVESVVELIAGQQYRIRIHTKPPVKIPGVDLGILEGKIGVRVGHMLASEHDKDLLTEAVKLAKATDTAIVFTGHEPSWETEGQDQLSFHLPKDGSQDRLVCAIAAANPNTIVVNSTGVPVAMPWLEDIKGLVQTWYPGQEAGNSIFDVLTGTQNPEGHLPCTFSKRLEDCPAFGNFPGEYDENRQLTVEYSEGVFVGYRHFDRLPRDKINFPFGFGLSYTEFTFSDFSVKESSKGFVATVNVTNTLSRAGGIAVQIYVGKVGNPSTDPIKTLVAFKKVTMQPNEMVRVDMPITKQSFSGFDEETRRWIVRGGDYKFGVSKSAADPVLDQIIYIEPQIFAL
ncbi:hypothetical protein PFICI_08867 [Pestalotiopsis fici W106-1]|uniref:beta-glucosidase n=1 Tax=Pestalotiopsis fici (strain W106-1 / CGMCC3.15140) TaxID=1229662 RepID=W3WZ03_PESFW|nr:uncharacterized protein PFICI_08867 [Pestalotiopsis fici W106-1]ETS79014.1 hypothetical protein PFICI_08867 [Pestalotiopsis fici W106-1]